MSDDAEIQRNLSARTSQVADMLDRKDKVGALGVSLQNPPINTKNDSIKEASMKVNQFIFNMKVNMRTTVI